MDTVKDPRLSVVVLAWQDVSVFHLSLRALKRQTIAGTIELILITDVGQQFDAQILDRDELHSLHVVETANARAFGTAKAEGVRRAAAPLVAFMEEHSFADRKWAEALLDAFQRDDYAHVGPIVRNANPGSATSWACYLVFYGQWGVPMREGEIAHLASNHGCYRRDVLLSYGERLPDMLEAESILHWDLMANDRKICQEPASIVWHLSFSKMKALLRETFLGSWVFAADRVSEWSPTRRLAYAIGSPLVPGIRYLRIRKLALTISVPHWSLFGAAGATMLTLCTSAIGEAMGYLFGYGRARERLIDSTMVHSSGATDRDLEEAVREADL